LSRDDELSRCCELLIQNGLFGVAAGAAEKIGNKELQSSMLTRIVREYILLFKAYGEESDWHRSIRESLLENAGLTVEKIVQPAARVYALDAILMGVLPYIHKENRTESLLRWWEEAFKLCRQIEVVEEKAELMSRLILTKITLEAGDREGGGRLPLLDQESNSTAIEDISKLITETLEIINQSQDVPQRGYALSSLAKALAQIGRVSNAQKLLKSAEETAKELTDKREAISVLLSLIPTFLSLNDHDAARKIYSLTFTIVSDSFIATPNTSEATFEWRLRDSELDRIVRSQLEQNFIIEAVVFADRIKEPLFRDRLLRTAAYIYMDEEKIKSAESAVRKMELDMVLKGALRDVLFLKRFLANKPDETKPDETTSAAPAENTEVEK
jgi:tetratricopeptide (TPR) repeat protein